ncbi:MAG: UDP-N-acetylglucosamine--N-acetylmuramyl-(pentapeptide) pyrophosphoryl-undecaprenol N-acetylglucosamine transferase [Patescibacteria group bacterium]|nr:UDP-N-acetylglucosamine--N-acetylmuramyl-(pentapeptide) pyrophosphoryl-undecaprenol N-acetylglucosamine transferase [Patescibacteria group bacterium]
MKILITGGHLAPALSVINELKNEDILYVGRKYALEGDKAFSLEYQAIRDLGIPFAQITTGRLQRKFTRYTIASFAKLPVGFYKSFLIVKRFKPDVVLGFGGYVSWPIIVAASILKIPVVIHEQTLGAGATNRMASRFAANICISFESSKKFFPSEKIILTGNPLRREIIEMANGKWQMANGQKNDLPLLYITGGSLGSHFINNLVKDSLSQLVKNFRIIHQTGDAKKSRDYDGLVKLKENLGENGKRYSVKKFLTPRESAEILGKADLVVSRAGINTVSELIFLGKPSLLIPLPFSQNNEQLKNAELLKAQGLGEILEQKETTTALFVKTLETIYININKYKLNSDRSKNLINENAAFKIAEVIKNVYKKKKIKK